MKLIPALLISTTLLFGGWTVSEARMAPPPDMPSDMQAMEPHNPKAAVYYLRELVREGVMTEDEAARTLDYMKFRATRRSTDLLIVKGMTREDRRAYMKKRRMERGNPLKEYADWIGVSYKRAETLLNAMHDSKKGTKYYRQLKQSESEK